MEQLISGELEKEYSIHPKWSIGGVIRGDVKCLERSVVVEFIVLCLTYLKVLVLGFN